MEMDVARFTSNQKEVAWLTRPVPKDLDPNGDFTFRWVAALGWIDEPAAEFDLMVGENKLVSFGVTHKETTWKSESGAVTLRFTPVSAEGDGQDSCGIMELNLPAGMLEPGEKARLRVIAPQTGSKRWFGIYHFP